MAKELIGAVFSIEVLKLLEKNVPRDVAIKIVAERIKKEVEKAEFSVYESEHDG